MAKKEESVTRIAVEIPSEVKKNIKIQSAHERRPIKDIVLDALNEYLRNHKQEERRTA